MMRLYYEGKSESGRSRQATSRSRLKQNVGKSLSEWVCRKGHVGQYTQYRHQAPVCMLCKRDRSPTYKYGVSEEDYDRMCRLQAGRCAACGESQDGNRTRMAFDHDHGTGAVRGLLCGKCNRGIGLFDDSPEKLRAAATYLESHHASTADNSDNPTSDRRVV